MTNQPQDEEAIFQAARVLASPEARADYLAQACGDDAALRQRVEALLRVHDEEQSFLQSPLPGTQAEPPPASQRPAESAGNRIGSYKLLELIGEGGMGSVWMAQQTEPVKRLVALKLIKAGLDSTQVLARFEAERQALAMMDHPNIARVFDGGSTPDGRPYFVMELVKGVPITKYADEHRLTPHQRLELFVPVCQAIQHAHQKGIIHRDIKPSNVLVTLYDDHPVPKVIDFGVAKATGQQLTERTLHTGFGVVVGTIEYMSPEQASFNQLDVDTRSDVYALGVLLYELLAGSPPFARKELERAGVLEMLRLIREQEPSRPSTKLSTAEGLPTLAANRGTEPKRLTALVRGELDWIVMRALEKDRGRRYETANAFAADVQRYLADEPVQACPPSAAYRLGKLLRRNKGPVAAAALVLLALIVGIIGTTWGLFQAKEEATERGKAEQQALEDRDLAETAKKQARDDQGRAEKAEKQAKLDRDDAVAQRDRVFLQQYALGMYPVSRLWQDGGHAAVRRMLDALRPGPDEPDLRGWEWHYQDRLNRGALRTLTGHHDGRTLETVQAMAFSPDGRWLASAGGGGTRGQGQLFLWDVATGKEVRRFHDQDQALSLVTRVSFSPDGKTLAASDYWSGAVYLWDAAGGRLLHKLDIRTDESGSLAFSPDGRQLVVAGYRTVSVWEVATGQQQGSWESESLTLAAFNSAGQVVTVSRSTITMHEPATGKSVGNFPHGISPSRDRDEEKESAAVSPDGKQLAMAAEDGIWLWDLNGGAKRQVVKQHTRKDCNRLSFSPDGQRLASAGKDGTVQLWDLQPQRRSSTIRVLDEGVYCVAFSPDRLRLAVAGRDGIIRLWDAGANGQESRRFTLLGGRMGLRAAVFTSDGEQFVALPNHPDGPHEMPYLHDAISGQKLPGQGGGQGPVAYSPDGRWLAAGCQEGIRVWDAATCKEVRTIPSKQLCISLAFVGPERLAAGLCGRNPPYTTYPVSPVNGDTVQIWDVVSGRELATLGRSVGKRLSPDGRHLYHYEYGSRQLTMWDLDRGQPGEKNPPQFTLQPHSQRLTDLAYSPDSRWLATTGQDPLFGPPPPEGGEWPKKGSWSVKLWDVATGKEVRSIPWPKDESFGSVTFSADGRYLAAAGEGLIKVWDVIGREVFTCAEKIPAWTMTLSPQGQYLAASGRGFVRVWDLKTGQETFTHKGNEQEMTVAFSPNGQFLSAFGRGYVRVWEATGRVVLNYPGRPIPGGGGITTRLSLAFSPDSGSLAVANLGSAARVWDLSTGRERFPQRWGSPPDSRASLAETIYGGGVAFSPDGRSLATGSPILRVHDAASGAELHTPGHIGWVTGMAIHPVEHTLAAGVGQVVRLFELGSWHPLRTFGGHNGEVAGVAFSPNGRLLAAGDGIWDLTEGRQPPRAVQPPTRRLNGNPRGITTLAFSPNAQLLYTFGAGSVKVWDVATGRELRSGKLAVAEKGAVVFSPDGQLLACVGDNIVHLWDLSKNQEARVLTVEDRMRRGIPVNALAFSPDGRRLAAVGVRIIRIWDTRTFQELYTISGVGPTGSLAFSPDGGRLLATGAIQLVGREVTPLSGHTTGAGVGGEQKTVVIYDGRPLTPEREVEREALGILDRLFNRPLSRKDVLTHLRTNPALSDPVRQAALRLATHYQE